MANPRRRSEYVNGIMHMRIFLQDGQVVSTMDHKICTIGDKNILTDYLERIIDLYGDGNMGGDNGRVLWKHRQDRVMWVMRYVKYGMALEYKQVIEEELAAERPKKPLPAFGASGYGACKQFFELRFGSPPLPLDKQPDISGPLNRYASLGSEAVFKGSSALPRICQWFYEGGNNAKNSLGDIMHTMINYHDAAPQNALERIVWNAQSMSEIIDTCNVQVKRLEEFFKDSCPEMGEKILDLGDNMAWWDLKAAYVPAEGQALGHCGNVSRIDGQETIISFRESMESNGIRKTRPMLTFIYHFNDGGYFGEMKGRANTKPSERYHKAIVDLLKLPRWGKMMGSTRDAKGNMRYSPEQNFCLFLSTGMNAATRKWTDLSPDLAKELHDANPKIWLMDGTCQYCKNVYKGWRGGGATHCARTMGISDEDMARYLKEEAK